jgi:hypothetical protein
MAKLVFRVAPGGEFRGLWHDMLAPLTGEMRTQRASHVNFDNEAQKWVAEILIGPDAPCCLITTSVRRKDVLAAEVEYFNDLLKSGAMPPL